MSSAPWKLPQPPCGMEDSLCSSLAKLGGADTVGAKRPCSRGVKVEFPYVLLCFQKTHFMLATLAEFFPFTLKVILA